MRSELITRVTRVLAEVLGDHYRFYQDPIAWVQIVEAPDGNLGAFGRVMRTTDILALAVHGELPEHNVDEGPSAVTAIDPICGMTVSLTDEAIVIDHDGTKVAFCSTTCRDTFLAERV